MGRLTTRERECLERLAGRAIEPPRDCDEATLGRLVALGLVKETAQVRVPLPMVRRCFHVTVAGQAALQEAERGPR